MRGTLFHWAREPAGSWLERLRQIAPPSSKTDWLKLVWMPGELYQPVQRWVIYLMIPRLRGIRDGWLLDELEGPDPRTRGHWVTDHRYPDSKRWVTDASISRMQWLLYRQTRGLGRGWRANLPPGCYPKLYWIVQGAQGGHKWSLSMVEKQILKQFSRKTGDVPAPGELPYAEPDERLWMKLEQMDRLRDVQFRLRQQRLERATGAEAGAIVRRERAQAEQAFRQQLNDWLETQIKAGLESLPRSTWANLPSGDTHYDHDRDEQLRAFIEDTPSAEG